MPARLFRLYQRKRIININLNIVIAGIVSMILSAPIVAWVDNLLGSDRHLLITVIAYCVDTAIDGVLYFALHWVANHWLPLSPRTEKDRSHHERTKRSFLFDAGWVQAERAVLMPVFGVAAMGGMWALHKFADIEAMWAFVFSFAGALCLTRVLHTLIGFKTGSYRDGCSIAK